MASSSGQRSITSSMTYLSMLSASSMSSSRSAKAISGSTIQNSAAWRAVLEFSARKVGPKVYTSPKAMAKFSAFSWPDTVREAGLPKKSALQSTSPATSAPSEAAAASSLTSGTWAGSIVVTRNISPAPSQSLAVMMGVCT